MAPNKRGAKAADASEGSIIKAAEVEARGRGTKEDGDSYEHDRR